MCKSILKTLRIKDKNINFSDEVIEKNVDDYFLFNKTKLAVLNKVQECRSQKSIAKSCLYQSMTVSRVINQAASDVDQSSFDALPEHLMMDEFKSAENELYARCRSHRIVDGSGSS